MLLVGIGIRTGREARKTETNAVYRRYDEDDFTAGQRSTFIPYNSYEFAGVKGEKRHQLQQSRDLLLDRLSPISNRCHLWNLVVLPVETVREQFQGFKPLRWSSMYTGIVHLTNDRKHLCFFDNGIYLVAVEECRDGIPFGLEEIISIEPSEHWVSLNIIEGREAALKNLGLLERMVSGNLAPGNY